MRELEFRYVYELNGSIIFKYFNIKEIENGYVSFFELNNEWGFLKCKEQYTGLKDKNSKKIYEGDILRQCNGSINGREWMDKDCAVKWTRKGYNLPYFMWDKDREECMDSTHWCKIISNIHENKEGRIHPIFDDILKPFTGEEV